MIRKTVAVVGGGPSGLSAAEVLSADHDVTVFDAMPTVARKLLLAGKSGLNITHAEDYARFATRFGPASPRLRPALDDFTPAAICAWAAELGTQTFVGSSGRVFPDVMKASPLLRAWLQRLQARGVRMMTRHRWVGFADAALRFETPDGPRDHRPDATLFALGGASWPRLGSDAAWIRPFHQENIGIAPFKPANCGFDVAWSLQMRARFAGEAVKSVTATSSAGKLSGEFVITIHGIEGGLVYSHSAPLRDALEAGEPAFFTVDLTPGRGFERLTSDLARQDRKASLSTRLRKGAGLDGVKAALIRELAKPDDIGSPQRLAALIKTLPIPLLSPRPIAEAISSAGGVLWNEVDENFMLTRRPGTFVAGEMLDWEAPTGGYLLTACMASGRAAGMGIAAWLSAGRDIKSTGI